MKKLILLALITIIMNGCTYDNPSRYKGCVVVDKRDSEYFNIQLKLTEEYRITSDYKWISVVNFELNKLNIGDTIK